MSYYTPYDGFILYFYIYTLNSHLNPICPRGGGWFNPQNLTRHFQQGCKDFNELLLTTFLPEIQNLFEEIIQSWVWFFKYLHSSLGYTENNLKNGFCLAEADMGGAGQILFHPLVGAGRVFWQLFSRHPIISVSDAGLYYFFIPWVKKQQFFSRYLILTISYYF